MLISRRKFMEQTANASLLLALPAQPANKPRLPRRDSFFGLHFDLHPNKDDTILGRDITDAMIDRLLTKVQPDYVQYDCKGHPGYTGYPTKVGTPSPGIVKDSLALWRRGTAKHGVALYIHYSGVWDGVAVEKHPDWAIVNADGKRDERNASPFGPYVDELLIPQLKEVAEAYDLDGVWIDGECWSVQPDYAEKVARLFTAATGQPMPRSAKDAGWREWLEFNRAQFRRYVRHYCDELHRARPGFQIASNWLYSTLVPEKPDLPVDFLSGDYLGNASISKARLEARFMGAQGKPWDLMAWGFQSDSRQHQHKPAVQLQQEASVVLAQGGGFQVYYYLPRGGHIDDSHVEVMAKLAKFCRARQESSHKSETVPQIGVLFSTHSLYNTTNRLFGSWGRETDAARGMMDALIDSQYSVDIIPEWTLGDAIRRYPLIVVPDWRLIGDAARNRLAVHLKTGGKILIAGAENAALFSKELGVRLKGPATEQAAYVPGDEVFANVSGLWQDIEPGDQTRVIATRYPNPDKRDGQIAATMTNCEEGQIAAIYGNVGTVYATYHTPAARHFIRDVVRQIFTPQIAVEAPPTVEVALRKKGGKLLIHLLNTTGMQVAADYAALDFVPPVGPIEIRLSLPQQPRRARLEPEGLELSGQWQTGVWSASLSQLSIHSIVALEF